MTFCVDELEKYKTEAWKAVGRAKYYEAVEKMRFLSARLASMPKLDCNRTKDQKAEAKLIEGLLITWDLTRLGNRRYVYEGCCHTVEEHNRKGQL